jgi:hypothetical protein
MGQEYKRRQYQADERQVEHDVLSLADKIEKAQSRRGESKREIARLTELLAESVNPQKQSPKRNKQ